LLFISNLSINKRNTAGAAIAAPALVLNLMAGSFQTFQQGFAVPQLKVIISCPD
jgi:hypothetical protein